MADKIMHSSLVGTQGEQARPDTFVRPDKILNREGAQHDSQVNFEDCDKPDCV